jgi:hypothetical protein
LVRRQCGGQEIRPAADSGSSQTPAAIRFLSVEPLLEDLGQFNIAGIDWAIVGEESGQGARPMKKAWVESIRKLCKAESVAFFFKQWGGLHKSKTGRLLNGKTYDAMSERVVAEMPSKYEKALSAQFTKERGKRWIKSTDHHSELVAL